MIKHQLLDSMQQRWGVVSALALCCVLASQPSYAVGVLLDFEGIGNLVQIQDFYNGGAAGNGVVGPNYNVSFFGNALTIVDDDNGGSGSFANEPSPDTILFWLNDADTHMNYSPGFTQFSLAYTAASMPGSLSFWTGANGTGTQVGSGQPLAVTGSGCGGDPTGFFSCWQNLAVVLPETAYSVTFAGTGNQIGFDNISFNPHQVDVPGPLPIFGAAVALRVSRRIRRRVRSASEH